MSVQPRWISAQEPIPPLSLPHSVEVWGVHLASVSSAPYALLLAPDEQERAARFVFAADRHRYIATRGILRTLLGHYLHQPPTRIPLRYSRYGKPFLENGNLHFSVAHSGDFALLAFDGAPLGVDVEIIQPGLDWNPLTRLVFTPTEEAWIAAQPIATQRIAFFTLWTRKEAFLKARGEGFQGNPTAVTLLTSWEGECRPDPPDPTTTWTIEDVLIDNRACAAVCYSR